MFYKYDEKNAICVPEPFSRIMTPIFMGDDKNIEECTFSIHMTEWRKGGKVDTHKHEDATEAMFCISGHGKCMIDEKEYEFTPGSLMVAPPNMLHNIENDGDELLRVLCIFSPPATGEGLRSRAMEAIDTQK